MQKLAYITNLTQSERAGAIQLGMAIGLARYGYSEKGAQWIPKPAGTEKKAQLVPAVTGGLEGLAKTIVAVSVLAGVPVGAAAHVIGRQIASKRRSEREQRSRIGYYRNAADQLETGLAGDDVTQP